MIFRVLLVDDEKTAMDNLVYLIEHYHPNFQIVGCAKHGEEALEYAREQKPDLVLTDIRMPHMDGLELVERLHSQLPDVYSIIISGYADFEYVRRAMIHGSIDYLLKPVDPRQMSEALQRAVPFLEKNIYLKRLNIIHRLCRGKPVGADESTRYFPEKAYCAAITRKNGLPSRNAQASPIELFSDEGAVIDLYGRDELESLYISPSALMEPMELARFTQRPFDQIPGYTTTVVWRESFAITHAPTVIQHLYQTLNRCLTVGKSQVIYIDRDTEWTGDYRHQEIWHQDFIKQITPYIDKRDYVQISQSLDHLLTHCRAVDVPEYLLENTVRIALSLVISSKQQTMSDFSLGVMIDDIFCTATSLDELSEGVDALVSEILRKPVDLVSGNQVLYNEICQYIEEHIAEPLSLPHICKQFGISQPTLSKLFREYASLSFNRFLTKKRIDRAVLLLSEDSLLIRDVAERVGYADQFYFSRIFRSMVGMSPSEFIAKHTES